jgi:hypothetical protein
MKRQNILILITTMFITAIVVININLNRSAIRLSAISIANMEAYTSPESGVGIDNTNICYGSFTATISHLTEFVPLELRRTTHINVLLRLNPTLPTTRLREIVGHIMSILD